MPYTKSVETGGGSSYPAVVDGNDDHDSLGWVLTWGTPEQLTAVRFAAAAVVNAYQSLIGATRARREHVVRAIRAGLKEIP
jgi:hypothetical protein